MIPYEEFLPLLPHEYSYAQYLSYGFDLCMYDPMILNMVSERYPRDEDYASDADSDSDSVTCEDDDSDLGDAQCVVPRWLIYDQEEDASLLRHDNNHLGIVFGSFSQDSDLDLISAVPFLAIKPDFDESTIKIGEITCHVLSSKQSSDYGSFFKSDDASKSLDLESSTTDDIEIGYDSDFSDCKNWTIDERSISANEIVNKQMIIEQEKSSIHMVDCIFATTGKPTDPDPTNQLLFQIVPSTSTFINDSTRRFSIVPFHSSSSPFSPDRTTSAFIPIDLVSTNHSHPSPFTFDPGEASIETVYTKKPTHPDLEHNFFSEIILLTSIRSSSFFNQNSISLLAADDDFVCAKSFINLAILKEMVKEMYLEESTICRGIDDLPFSVVGRSEENSTTPPWKLREEDLFNVATPFRLGSRTFSLLHHTGSRRGQLGFFLFGLVFCLGPTHFQSLQETR